VISLYKQASIYALSSRFEGMPLVLLEAMHMGLPMVAFDCEYGPSELISDGYNGILVENGRAEKLAEALLELMQNNEKRIAMSRNALLASKSYSIESVSRKWMTLFDGLHRSIAKLDHPEK
jgi:glycosyltransferase involved in cell wall biosynthesis